MNNIIDLTLDAITASGKRFSELPKEAMFMFLQRNGVSKEDTNNIYDKIGNICNNTRDKIYSGTSVFKAPKGTPHYVSDKYIAPDEQDTYKVEDANVDYGTDSNGVKKREPRKNLFSEVIKLT
jgi:hypothetical protein